MTSPSSGSMHDNGEGVVWHRSGTTIYTLEQNGWHRGQPDMVNGYTIQISGRPRHSDEETEAVAAMVHAALSSPVPSVDVGHREVGLTRVPASGAAAVLPPRVKALVWDENFYPGIHKASPEIGPYMAFADGTLTLNGAQLSFEARTLDGTKAAAQADYERRILAALDLPPSGDAPDPSLASSTRYVRHKRRGTTYRVIGVGKMQAGTWAIYNDVVGYSDADMAEVVTYQCLEDGALWVRPVAEFEDGRFEDVPAPEGVAAARLVAGVEKDEVERLREAARPFTDYIDTRTLANAPDILVLTNGSTMARRQVTLGDFRRLRDALARSAVSGKEAGR